jgi:hypothetical protein
MAEGAAIEGVELEQLAAVHVDLDAGFSVEEALRTEGLEAEAFARGEIGWKVRLADGGAPFLAYREATAAHQDRIARPIAPLDDDLDAWVIFLRCYQEHRDPFDMLQALGIAFGDVARLGRRWTARLDASPRLAKRAVKVADRLELRATKHRDKARLPLITVGKPRLLASPAAMRARRRAQEKDLPPRPEVPVPELTIDAYAALVAALRVAPKKSRGEVLARLGLTPDQAQVLDDVWQQKIADDALLRSDFRVLCRHFEEAARLRKRGAEQAAARIFEVLELPSVPHSFAPLGAPHLPGATNDPSRRSVDATAFWSAEKFGDEVNRTSTMPALVLDAVLPFVEGDPVFHACAPLSERSIDLDGTGALIPALLDADVLPFASRSSDLDTTGALDPSMLAAGGLPFDNSPLDGDVSLVGALLAVDFDEPEPEGVRSSDDLSGTSAELPVFRALPVLPFGVEATARQKSPPSDLDGTSAAIPVFDEVLPFAPTFEGGVDVPDVDPFGDWTGAERAGPKAPMAPTSGREMHPPDRGALDGTAFLAALGDGDLDATTAFVAIDFDDEPDASATRGDLDTTTAFLAIDLDLPDEPASSDPAPRPSLTLEQYASLTVELERWPAHAPAILARYGLTDHAAEGAAWGSVLADPAEGVRFAALCAQYRAWLASQG